MRVVGVVLLMVPTNKGMKKRVCINKGMKKRVCINKGMKKRVCINKGLIETYSSLCTHRCSLVW